jgi:hypothetical protein
MDASGVPAASQLLGWMQAAALPWYGRSHSVLPWDSKCLGRNSRDPDTTLTPTCNIQRSSRTSARDDAVVRARSARSFRRKPSWSRRSDVGSKCSPVTRF